MATILRRRLQLIEPISQQDQIRLTLSMMVYFSLQTTRSQSIKQDAFRRKQGTFSEILNDLKTSKDIWRHLEMFLRKHDSDKRRNDKATGLRPYAQWALLIERSVVAMFTQKDKVDTTWEILTEDTIRPSDTIGGKQRNMIFFLPPSG